MEWIDLDSRLISSVAYNHETETLHVWLRSKRHMVHANVSEATFQNLVDAESAGFYYSYYIAQSSAPSRLHTLRFATRAIAIFALAAILFSVSATEIANAGHNAPKLSIEK